MTGGKNTIKWKRAMAIARKEYPSRKEKKKDNFSFIINIFS